ncbi:hypothetical protein C8J46_105103 [Sphingomonas sp. PP-F2F-A104-K0414]|uniref:hypothetical protein n=1 Tax=Sphingomonas sp. PP-F2F-A104-K0414 TaxID=2135661 RepID=UPI001051393C|nr:hypothetical protein [Sphingomonas sp. PP-F2F-A104-K0414]TCP97958.1 hypothetical protein C8J46_105103 [Sphingomonas sp. PP-F2F-A104-K0414]
MIGFRASAGNAHPIRADIVMDPVIEDMSETVTEPHFDEPSQEPAPERGPLFAGIAVAIVAIWLAAMLWIARGSLATIEPVALVQFIAALCIVPALVGIVWLLTMRTSRTEAHRFGITAQAMRDEAASLERTVAVLSDTIDANRQHLAEQLNALMAMGGGATEQLAAIGRGMVSEIDQAAAHARNLATSTAGAQTSLGVLIATLPRAQADIDDVAKRLERTGLSASEHAAALDAQIVALAERGREADAMASGAAQRLAAHIVRMEATSQTAGAHLESVTDGMSAAVDALLNRTADAVDLSRRGIAAQGDAMLAMVGANQAALDSAARDSAEALAHRIAAVEDAIERVAIRLDLQRSAGDRIVDDLHTGLGEVESRIELLHRHGTERTQDLAASISALGGSANAMTEALRAGDDMAHRTIATTETLLVALDAAAREIDETMPEALGRLDSQVLASKSIVVSARPELLALVTAAESTHDAIEAIAGVISEQRLVLDTLSTDLLNTLNTGRAKADALGHMVDEAIGRTQHFAEDAAPQLIEALHRVRETAAVAADKARETLSKVIPEAAAALEAASADAMRRATNDTVERQVKALTDATGAAVDAATGATERLAREVQTIVDQTAIVETRIQEARTEREDADQDTFARRVSLLIESLNSASIDITKAIAPEISDSAWGAYLKGDRGVFTRRAVRILDASEVREIAGLYDEDETFREMVNRYIHDFEAMLRTILTQRDGSPLGVTLLSSDMGKLYVALAQAIERLR